MDQNTQPTEQYNLPTHPLLILYTLTVLGYYHAATVTAHAIQNGGPTANGLFPSQRDQYQYQFNSMNAKDQEASVTIADDSEKRMLAAAAEFSAETGDPSSESETSADAKDAEELQDEDETDDMGGYATGQPSVT